MRVLPETFAPGAEVDNTAPKNLAAGSQHHCELVPARQAQPLDASDSVDAVNASRRDAV